MEYKHDFLKRKGEKSRTYIFMGLFLAVSSIYFFHEYATYGVSIVYFIWGVNTFFNGMGIPPASLVGKKFILVNPEKIHFKYYLLKKGKEIYTKDIGNIDLWPGLILAQIKNEKKEKIDMRDLDPQTRHDALMAIISVAEKKQIKYCKHGYLQHYN